jgi:hypothetical protein
MAVLLEACFYAFVLYGQDNAHSFIEKIKLAPKKLQHATYFLSPGGFSL